MWLYQLLKIKVTLLLVFSNISIGQKTITINTRLGQIIGREDANVLGNGVYYSFRGIPYTEKRIEERRYDPPKVFDKPWQGIFNATIDMGACPQYRYDSERIWRGNEDCLYMNVFTPCHDLRERQNPQYNNTKKYPIIVLIHGGEFLSGVADQSHISPDYIIQHDVILVTINYRMGAVGFLNLYTKNALGNNGLKDQVVALKWIQQNIEDYCGDPQQVTLFGSGAGAKMVQYHAYSPLSKGLYHRSIQDSPMGTQRGVVVRPREAAFEVGRLLGINTSDPDVLLNGLKLMRIEKIVNAATAVNLHRVL